jgi:hypothetical protein
MLFDQCSWFKTPAKGTKPEENVIECRPSQRVTNKRIFYRRL